MTSRGAMPVNVGRGKHVVDDDLIKALDSGQLSYAALDALWPEPLPSDKPSGAPDRIDHAYQSRSWMSAAGRASAESHFYSIRRMRGRSDAQRLLTVSPLLT